jgi:hypothetical protein
MFPMQCASEVKAKYEIRLTTWSGRGRMATQAAQEAESVVDTAGKGRITMDRRGVLMSSANS